MTCRSFEKSLPLLAGGDLRGRKAEKARSHLASCPACRREAADFEAALAAARALARADASPVWTEAEWRNALRSVIAGSAAQSRKASGPGRRLRPVLAYGLGVAALAGIAVSVLRKPPIRPAASFVGTVDLMLRQPAGPHLTSVRFLAKSGRIEVVWFFNRDFPTDFFGK